jgi:hypothetical protein
VEDQTSLLQGSMQEDSFEVVMRGYNKRQVDDYVLQCQHHIRDLAQRLALAEQEIERVRVEATTAIEKAASKPVHEEVSERLAQILRLANEEAERERASAADEIAALRAQTAAETQNMREQAQRESDALRQQVLGETDTQRDQVKAETEALREQVNSETDGLRQRAEQQAARELEAARVEADQVLSSAREAAERDVAEAHSAARQAEETSRTESERLMLAAQERAETVIGEAERRANAINTVLGGRLEILTTTHKDVVGRLTQLRATLIDVLGSEEILGAFEVPPSPAEMVARGSVPSVIGSDPYVQTAGEVAAAYEAAAQNADSASAAEPTWGSRHAQPDPAAGHRSASGEVSEPALLDTEPVDAPDAVQATAAKARTSKATLDKDGLDPDGADTDGLDKAGAAPSTPPGGLHATRSLDLTGVTADKSGGR